MVRPIHAGHIIDTCVTNSGISSQNTHVARFTPCGPALVLPLGRLKWLEFYMRKWKLHLLFVLISLGAFHPESAEARRVRRGVGAANFIAVNRLGRFGLFNRAFFPFFGFGRQFGFFRPVVIPFEANVINPFNPFSGDILGSGHDFGPQPVTPQQQQSQPQSQPQPQTPTPIDNGAQRAVADTAPTPQTNFSDHNPSDLQKILANAVRSIPNAQSTAGEWSDTLCNLTENYAGKMARQGFQDGHAGFRTERFPVASGVTGGSAEEITAQGAGTPEQAAATCASSWYLSSEHKGSLLNYHRKFCYSMARSANGNYYCVGLFANGS